MPNCCSIRGIKRFVTCCNWKTISFWSSCNSTPSDTFILYSTHCAETRNNHKREKFFIPLGGGIEFTSWVLQ